MKMSMKCRYSRTFFEQWLRDTMGKVGRWIGESPFWCLWISLFVFGGFALGMISLQLLPNLDGIRFIENGPVLRSSQEIESKFPTNFSHFTPDRSVNAQTSGVVVLISKDRTNILTHAALKEVHWVHDRITNSKLANPGTIKGAVPQYFSYHDVCAKWQGQCFLSHCLRLGLQSVQNRTVPIRYPLSFDSSGDPVYLPGCLADPVFRNGSEVEVVSAPAIRLPYFLDERDGVSSLRAEAWQQHFVKTVKKLPGKLNHTEMHFYSSILRDDEVRRMTLDLGPTIAVSTGLLVAFSVVCGLTTDCVVTKPYVGIAAMISTALGIGAGLGMAGSLGIVFSPTCTTVPFLCLGLGLDSAFILLGAWRATDEEKSVPNRMARAYEHAAVAISITTVTDILTFLIGSTIPHGAVRIFCYYMSLAVFMTFLTTITFFGAMLAIFGRCEAANRHGFTFRKIATPSSAKNVVTDEQVGSCTMCCRGCGKSTKSKTQYIGISERIFRRLYAPLLNRKSFKLLVVLGYVAYATIACIGVVQLEMDIDELRGLPHDSPTKIFRELSLEYFRYNIRIQVMLKGKYNYSDASVRARIEEMTSRAESGPHLVGGVYFTHSWIRQYDFWLEFERMADSGETDVGVVSLSEFVRNDPVYKGDVVWDKDGSIEASRFFLQMAGVKNVRDLTEGITHLKSVFQDYPEFEIHAYHSQFRMYELAEMLPKATRETVALAFGAMIVVAFFLIPKWSGIFVVTCSILSVMLGVVGYMTLWGVYYDLYSMVVLIMSIGFSVDFCAHTAYSFYSQKPKPGEDDKNPVEKLGIGLTHVGLPILQGTTSTVIAVAGLLLTGIYAHIMFFKVVFLIMTIGALHAIVFLPVCMLIFETFPWPPWKVFKRETAPEESTTSTVGDGFEPCPRDVFLPKTPSPPSYEESTLARRIANGIPVV